MAQHYRDPWAKKTKAGMKTLDGIFSLGTGLASALVASSMTSSTKARSNSAGIAQQRRMQRELEKAQTKADSIVYAHEYNAVSESVVNTISLMPRLIDCAYLRRSYTHLRLPKPYTKSPYPETEPTMDEIIHSLKLRAEREISSILFWTNKAKRHEYVEANKDRELADAMRSWRLRKEQWDKEQEENELKVNAEKMSEYEEKKRYMETFLNGGGGAISESFNALVEELELPYQISVSCAFMDELGALSIDIELPDIAVIPADAAKVLASGKVSVKAKAIKDRNKEYVTSTLGLAYVLAAVGFNSGAAVDCAIVSAHVNKYDEQSVSMKEEYVYAIAFGREEFAKAVSPSSSPIGGLLYFPHNIKMTKSYVYKKVDPTAIEELVTEMKEEED